VYDLVALATRARREARGMTQGELGTAIGTNATTICRLGRVD
jgi:DNA-binding XRE family transcriptional regulator